MTTSYREQFATQIERERHGGDRPAWLTARRRQALARFEALGIPTTKNEDWHYTSLARLNETMFEPMAPAASEVRAGDVAEYAFGEEWPTVVFVNGRYSAALSSLRGLSSGVQVMRLASAVMEEPTLLEQYLTRIASFDEHALTALNTAFLHDGVVLHVHRDANITTPIHILNYYDAAAAGGVDHPRALIVVERNARATVIEQYVGVDNTTYFTNAVTEIAVADGAT
ncbi:MAG: Fe-S cluster assembly protein SufD, partial [Gemmatimonadota bacterium]